MAAKLVQVSSDDVTYYNLPGNQGEMTVEGESPEDTIFGNTFRSNFTGLLNWQMSGNAVYKGYAGYQAKIKKGGTPVSATAEPMTLVSGKTYEVTLAARRCIDRSAAITVKVSAASQNSQVESIDYVNGRVTFKAAYTPGGAVTMDYSYVPLTDVAWVRDISITQTAEPIDETDLVTAQSNSGYMVRQPGLRGVRMETSGIFKAASTFLADLTSRSIVVIEVNPDGAGLSSARGWFQLQNHRISGNVGALEEQNLSWNLYVPDLGTATWALAAPFAWVHQAGSTMPQALQKALNAWQTETRPYMKYLPDGVAGWKGQGVITNISLQQQMTGINTFSVTMAGTSGLTTV